MREIQVLGELSKTVRMDQIIIDKNHRLQVAGHLDLLMASIRAIGLLEPIGLVDNLDGTYTLVYGHRRFAACKKLGFTEISAVIRIEDQGFNPKIAQLAENYNRTTPTLLEAGGYIKKMIEDGLSIAEIAAASSMSVESIKRTVGDFDGVPDEFKGYIASDLKAKQVGKIPARIASAIRRMEKKEALPQTTAKKLYKLARTHGPAFKMGELKGYVRNIESGKAWDAAHGKNVRSYGIFSVTDDEYNRIVNKYVKVKRPKYRSFSHVIKAILTGNLRERIAIIEKV